MDRGIVTNTNTNDMSTSTNIDTVTNVTVSIGAAPQKRHNLVESKLRVMATA